VGSEILINIDGDAARLGNPSAILEILNPDLYLAVPIKDVVTAAVVE
jgi:hypothetical protein